MNGRHLILDCWGCGQRANDPAGACAALRQAVTEMRATLLDLRLHAFSPQGFTAVAILSESHVSIHSWPERGYVGVDVFTCGKDVRPEAGMQVLREFFEPRNCKLRILARGDRQDETLDRADIDERSAC